MSRNMSRSSAQTSPRDFREIDRRIEKPKAVFKYNSTWNFDCLWVVVDVFEVVVDCC